MIQLRNLTSVLSGVAGAAAQGGAPVGVRTFLARLAERFPAVRIGSFSRYIYGDKRR
jgi:hypothetical protein